MAATMEKSELGMAMESESDGASEEEVEDTLDDVAHEKLINSIYALDGKNRKKNVVRGIPVGSSNFDFAVHANADKHKIGPDDLKLKQKHGTSSQLKKPMSELEVEKARRQLARESMVAEANKWDPVVKEIRLAPQTIYSQREHGLKMHEAMKPKAFVPRTPLEQELYAALGRSEDIITTDKELTAAEEKALKAMSLKEARARRAELMKHHELLSRMELKAKRLKKIKSKRYRKILRREKSAKDKKELEELQKSDPDAFLEKMDMLERARMEERLTLKHRGGGKFSRLHKAYSKFDDKTRSAIQDMLHKSKELTQRRQDAESSDGEDNEDKDDKTDDQDQTKMQLSQVNKVSPAWMKALSKRAGGWLDGPKPNAKTPTETTGQAAEDKDPTEDESEGTGGQSDGEEMDTVESFASPPKKRQKTLSNQGEEVNESQIDSLEASTKDGVRVEGDVSDDDEEEEEALTDPSEPRPGKRPMPAGSPQKAEEGPKKKKQKRKKKSNNAGADEDLAAGTNVPAKSKIQEVTLHSVEEEKDEEPEEESDNMRVTMEELFADEDFVEEFAKEKAEAEAKERPKMEDTKLPGWGSWAGPDYKEREARQQKRKKKPQAKPAKQFVREANVWLNPKRDDSIRKFQPKGVPFPYTSVQQYEASLRQPVSRGFVRESAFKLLTKPEVVTKQGHIIKPLNKDDYFGEKDVSGADVDDKNFGTPAEDVKSKQKKHGKRRSLR